jgi:citrate lyase beta subunit
MGDSMDDAALTLAEQLSDELDGALATADADLAARYPGPTSTRQPVHTVYIPAHLLRSNDGDDPTGKWGTAALDLLDQFGSTAGELAGATGIDVGVVEQVLPRVRDKLSTEPVEDLRIDFEDGYGDHGDTEDDDARRAVQILRQIASAGSASTSRGPFRYGVRIKCLEPAVRRRGLRTLSLVISGLTDDGRLPVGLVTTLPKVTSVDQVSAFVRGTGRIEQALRLPERALRFEIQVETPQAILGADGRANVAAMLHAAEGRCTALHYGTYDYSASLGIPAAEQRLDHPAADHAKAVMQLAAAGTGVEICDGSTNVLPVGSREQVHAAWRLHARLVRRSLDRGYYQGWDMHPGHLVTRYLATYAFFRTALDPAARRLRIYLDGAAGGVMDEPATALALATAILRGVDCGALDAEEAAAAVGADLGQLAVLARRPVGD